MQNFLLMQALFSGIHLETIRATCKVWTDESVTKNPDNAFLQYYANNPFDTLNAIKDGIVLLDSQATKYYPSISNTFNTVVFNAVFENGDDIQETLDLAQEDLENEFGY